MPTESKKYCCTQPGSSTMCQQCLVPPSVHQQGVFFPTSLQSAAADEPDGLSAGAGWE